MMKDQPRCRYAGWTDLMSDVTVCCSWQTDYKAQRPMSTVVPWAQELLLGDEGVCCSPMSFEHLQPNPIVFGVGLLSSIFKEYALLINLLIKGRKKGQSADQHQPYSHCHQLIDENKPYK